MSRKHSQRRLTRFVTHSLAVLATGAVVAAAGLVGSDQDLRLASTCCAAEPEYSPYYPEDEPIDVNQRELVGFRSLKTFDFTDPNTTLDGWEARNGVSLSRGERSLVAEMNIFDPYFFSSSLDGQLPPGPMLVKLRVRRTNKGKGQIFFADETHGYQESASTTFDLAEDDEFHDYVVPLESTHPILRLRFDVGTDEGLAEIERIELIQILTKPLNFGVASLDSGTLNLNLVNSDPSVPQLADLELHGFNASKTPQKSTIEVVDRASLELYYPQKRPFEKMEIIAQIKSNGQRLARRYFAFNESLCEPAPEAVPIDGEAPTLRCGALAVRFAPDGSGAEIFRDGTRVAAITPLVYEEGDGAAILPKKYDYARELDSDRDKADDEPKAKGRIEPVLRSVSEDGREIEFSLCEIPFEKARDTINALANESDAVGESARNRDEDLAAAVGFLKFKLNEETLDFDFTSPRKIHAPVIRVLGEMQQAVFPGVEYLEKGEHSSSTADIKTKEHIRYAPSIYWITQPYAAITTDRGSVTMLYDEPKTQPVFAVPNFIDGDADSSRMNLCADAGAGKIRIVAPEPIENAILWATNAQGLPEPPIPPLRGQAQKELVLAALERSIIVTPQGWAHALLDGNEPYSFTPSYGSDFISTIWEITGKIPQTPRIDLGGSHVTNYSVYFLTGKGEEVVKHFKERTRSVAERMKPDGSYRYYGKFLWGNQTDYASGNCGNSLFALGETWSYTGSKDALAALLKGLDFMNALLTPRGAQVWELSLHTPDVMGSSRCCMANVWAYEATGDEKYLAAARRWALTGLPFVYLWGDRTLRDFDDRNKPADAPVDRQPIMKYATIPVFGATGWSAPNWMGRPVQWCGLDYARALILLSKHDKTLDWRKIAEGIVASAECQLCVSDDLIGLLPDSFEVETQEPFPYYINPCVVYMLRRELDGDHTNLSIVDVDGKRVASPFPARVEDGVVKITAKKGLDYQIMIDGEEVRTIQSEGEDEIQF